MQNPSKCSLDWCEFVVNPVLGLLLRRPLLPLLGDFRGEVLLPVSNLSLPNEALGVFFREMKQIERLCV